LSIGIGQYNKLFAKNRISNRSFPQKIVLKYRLQRPESLPEIALVVWITWQLFLALKALF
jgi:hypothetical protein